MLRDASKFEGDASLSVKKNHSVEILLTFIDRTISGFRNYYFSDPDISGDENTITYHIANYFNALLVEEQEGFLPFNFVKNPPQPQSRKETDLGVVILNKSTPGHPIIEFEAKRLSNSSNNSEYVYGLRGGIERFKRCQHGARLLTCGMFGYIQNAAPTYWLTKVNEWIVEQSKDKSCDLDWMDEKEMLSYIGSFEHVNKYSSINKRIGQDELQIYHYFIDLVKS